jgi:hypothetical protein
MRGFQSGHPKQPVWQPGSSKKSKKVSVAGSGVSGHQMKIAELPNSDCSAILPYRNSHKKVPFFAEGFAPEVQADIRRTFLSVTPSPVAVL